MSDGGEVRTGRGGIDLKELVAAAGVILSLVFVGMEVHQNTLAVRSSTLQALTDAHREMVLASAMNPQHQALIARTMRGETTEDFTDDENTSLLAYYVVLVSHLQNTYLQREAGVVDDQVFESYGWHGPILRTAHFAEWRDRALEAGTSAEFADFFRQWMADHP